MRFHLRTLFVAVLLAAIVCAGVTAYWRRMGGPVYYGNRIRTHLLELQGKRPPELTAPQWKCMVDWTQNLHGNSLIQFQASLPEIAAFERRLDERLQKPVDAEVIEWIWDEYANVCPGGRKYQRFRLMVNEELTSLQSPVLLQPPPPDEP